MLMILKKKYIQKKMILNIYPVYGGNLFEKVHILRVHNFSLA